MRRLILPVLALAIGASCTTRNVALRQAPTELLSTLDMKDPGAIPQMTHGLWKLEAGAWRWSRKRMRVVLQAPKDASTKGAMLELDFSLPERLISAGDPVTIQGSVNGMGLSSILYADLGNLTFQRVVPPEAFTIQPAVVEIMSDRALPPIPGEERELAFIVHKIGLLPR